MRSARRRLLLSIFRCDDFAIVDELAEAVKRGADVRVLMTQRARGWKTKLKDLAALLRSFGADVRLYENQLMKYHAKYIVADDGPALVTSLNLTRKCFESTSDFMLFSHDPGVVAGLEALFQHDSGSNAVALPDMTDRLIIGPEHCRRRLTEIISSARMRIRIMDHRLTDPQIMAVLARKQAEGVSVEVLGKGPLGGLWSHGRIVLIDDQTAIIGSMHLSAVSLDSRREVAIVVEEPSVTAELQDYFQSRLVQVVASEALPAYAEDEDDEDEE